MNTIEHSRQVPDLDRQLHFNALRELCRPCFADAEKRRISIDLEQGLDWMELFRIALLHDVSALAAHGLLRHCPELLSDDMREGLDIYLEGERLRARKLTEELKQILDYLAVKNIQAIPIKGPQLALCLYNDAGLRNCRDLDFLVRDADVSRTLAALDELGYRHETHLSIRQIEAVRRYGGQYILYHPQRTPVEPHWQLAPLTLAFDLDYRRFWHESLSGDFLGVTCRRLSPEQELLVLCLHGGKEQWPKLKLVCDVARFLAIQPALDWEHLFRETDQCGCTRMLNLGLLLAQRLLAAPLPADVLLRIEEDTQAERLAAGIIEQLAGNRPADPNPYRLTPYYWRIRERSRDRWVYLLRTIITPRAIHYELAHLPGGLGYYPLKLICDYLYVPVWGLAKATRGFISGKKHDNPKKIGPGRARVRRARVRSFFLHKN